MFGTKTKIIFSEIKEISYKEGSLLDRFGTGKYSTRYNLLLETTDDPPVSISQFRNEKDVTDVVSALKKFLLNNERIIV